MSRERAFATARDETPVFFRAGDEMLLGVLTRPTVEPNGVGVVLAQGGSPSMVSFQRNRVAVGLARRLAQHGLHVLRFDYHGAGESTGSIEFRLDAPCVLDLLAAADCLRRQGVGRIVVVGSCFGARTALAAAPKIEGLQALVLVAMSVCDDLDAQRADEISLADYVRRALDPSRLRGLLDPGRRAVYRQAMSHKGRALLSRIRQTLRYGKSVRGSVVPRGVMSQLEAAVGLGIPILFLYGKYDSFYRDFERAQRGPLGRILADAGDRVTVRGDLDGTLHGYRTIAVQNAFLDAVEAWVGQRVVASTGMAESSA